ncbi:hypothetical protein ACWEPL_20465 [Nonomuraea sp. NPDC004186]
MAGTLFVLPGMPALLVLSAAYILWQDTTVVTVLFSGIAPAVPPVVAVAAFAAPALCCRRESQSHAFRPVAQRGRTGDTLHHNPLQRTHHA